MYYFECECGSPEHTLQFSLDEELGEIHTSVFLNNYRSVFVRIWVAVKYVFGYKCRYGHWDCWIMKKSDSSQLRMLLDEADRIEDERAGR